MSKYSLIINTDDINDLVKVLTPSIVETVRNAAVDVEQPKAEVAKKTKKAAKAVETPVEEAPVEAEDFSDITEEAEAPAKVATKQEVADLAVVVGTKHGRDTMIACIKKFSKTDKLAGVAEADYGNLYQTFKAVEALSDKKAAAEYLKAI